MSAYSSSKISHSMTSLVRNNRTTELYRRGITSLYAVLYRIIRPKPGHYSPFFLTEVRAEQKKGENVEET